MAEEVVIKKGLLQKVGHSSTLFWHTRWFVLYGGTDKTPPRLTYAKKENDELLGEVDLSDYNLCDADDKKKNVFKIANSEEEEIRPYVICANNESEAAEWIEAFRQIFKSDAYIRAFKDRQDKKIRVGHPPPERTLLVNGWMKKLGGGNGGAKNWKKRWFKNTEETPLVIQYYTTNSPKKANLKGEVDLTQLQSVVFEDEKDGSLHITATTPGRVWEFLADADEKEYWRTSFTGIQAELKRAAKEKKRKAKHKHRHHLHHYGVWQECLDPKNRKYYWNTQTNLTQWEEPEEVKAIKKSRKARKERERKLEDEEDKKTSDSKHRTKTLKRAKEGDAGTDASASAEDGAQTAPQEQQPAPEQPKTQQRPALPLPSQQRPQAPLPQEMLVSSQVPQTTQPRRAAALPTDAYHHQQQQPNTTPVKQHIYTEDYLPPGWKKAFDIQRNHVYFYNKEKNITQWTVPEE